MKTSQQLLVGGKIISSIRCFDIINSLFFSRSNRCSNNQSRNSSRERNVSQERSYNNRKIVKQTNTPGLLILSTQNKQQSSPPMSPPKAQTYKHHNQSRPTRSRTASPIDSHNIDQRLKPQNNSQQSTINTELINALDIPNQYNNLRPNWYNTNYKPNTRIKVEQLDELDREIQSMIRRGIFIDVSIFIFFFY